MKRLARRIAAAAGALAALAVLAVGCGEEVVLSKGDTAIESDAVACLDKDCGDSCLFDTCDTHGGGGAAATCNTAAAPGYCNGAGKCVLDPPACRPWVPCPRKTATCGDKCWPCDPKSPDCNPPEDDYTCTNSLSCLPGKAECDCVGVDCPVVSPCQNLGCGDPCDCDPEQSSQCPQSTTSPTFCDANGRCLPVEEVACPKGYQPCENKLCGQSCSVCEPGNKSCDNKGSFVCDSNGECTVAPVSCTIPCTPARCGEACLPCDPTDPGCSLPPSSFCDEYGACKAGDQPYCPCTGATCGMACFFCDDDGTNCDTTVDRSCDPNGACVLASPPPVCP